MRVSGGGVGLTACRKHPEECKHLVYFSGVPFDATVPSSPSTTGPPISPSSG